MKKKRIELSSGEINYIKDLLRECGQDICESVIFDVKELSFIENIIKKLEGSK